MEKNNNQRIEMNRSVVKYTTTTNVGVEPMHLTRSAIGYVIRGEKHIHESDRITRVKRGDIFFMGQGSHHVENNPLPGESFEQLTFYFTPAQMQQIIASLDISSSMLRRVTAIKPGDERRYSGGSMVFTPTKILANLFNSANRHYELGGFLNDQESERLKLMEIVHTIFLFESDAFKLKLMQTLDKERANFERIVYSHLLHNITVDQLASECNRSLTSFKKDFKDIFGTPPHQWYLMQRLNYAKMLLSTTHESIMNIGITCTFPNTSHFIKLFKRNFGETPAVYRGKR